MNETPKQVRAAHAGIVAALAAAQAEMGPALKQASNPHLKSKYADLSSVTDACMPALNRHGIAVYHTYAAGEGGDGAISTVFCHESGERIETVVPLLISQRTMQGLGSAITYARRYGLMMLAGIAPEDDDGNEASKSPVQERPASSRKSAQQEPVFDAKVEADQLCSIFSAAQDEAQIASAWAASAEMRRKIYDADARAHERIKRAAADRKSAILSTAIADEIPF